MRFPPIRLLFALAAAAGGSPAAAAEGPCSPQTFEEARYIVCSIDLAAADAGSLRMAWRDAAGEPYRTFPALAESLAADGKTLAFAMNGGMYSEDFAPTGLYVENGREFAPLNTSVVTGAPADIPNFYKRPNGVFYIGEGTAGVVTTEGWQESPPAARYATQSGPMLVIGGAIHPAFIDGSTDRKPRDGVCVTDGRRVHFAITDGRVNFHDFARFFRDGLGCRDALFLDGGSAPGLYAPELGRADRPGHGGFGPIVALVR